MSESVSVLKNSFWFLISKLNVLLSGILFFSLLARGYSKSEIGELTYSLTIVSVLAIFSGAGLNTTLIKYLTNSSKALRQKLIFTSLLIQSALGIFVMLITFIITDNHYISVLSATLIFKSGELFKCAFDADLRTKYYTKAESTCYLFITLFKILLVYTEVEISALVYVFVLESFLLFLCYLFIFKVDFGKLKVSLLSFCEFKKLLVDSFPVLLSGALYILYSRVDQIMVYHILGAGAQAELALSTKLSEGWYFIPLALVTSYFSVLSKHANDSRYYQIFSKACVKVNLITIPVAFITILFSDKIVSLLYGSSYEAVSVLLNIQVFCGVVAALSALTFRHFILTEQRYLSVLRAIFGLVLNVILNFLLIDLYGLVGSVIATLVAQVVALFISNCLLTKTRLLFFIQLKSLFFIRYKQSM